MAAYVYLIINFLTPSVYVEFGVASTDSIREGFIKVLTSPKRGERGFSQSRLKIRSFFEWFSIDFGRDVVLSHLDL